MEASVKVWDLCIFLGTICVAVIFHTVNAEEIIRDILELENSFLDLHPDIDYVPWEETANLTGESLKNVCDQVLPFLITESDSVNNYTYELPTSDDIRSERMIKNALLPLENHNDEVGHVPVIKCFYKEKKFYLTHANDQAVFELHCEDAVQEIYTLKSGVYGVEYL